MTRKSLLAYHPATARCRHCERFSPESRPDRTEDKTLDMVPLCILSASHTVWHFKAEMKRDIGAPEGISAG